MISDTLLLFDLDNTLVYSEKIDSKCFGATFKERYGQPFPTIDWTYFSHVTDHTIFREAYFEIKKEYPTSNEIEEFKLEFVKKINLARQENPKDFNIIPGASDLFAYLRKEEIPFAVATGGWEAPARVKLKHVGLWQSDLIISGADNQYSRNELINEAIQRCQKRNFNWNKIIYVGDAIWDVKTCREMELPLLGIKRVGDHQELLKHGVSHVITNYADINEFFEKIRAVQVPE